MKTLYSPRQMFVGFKYRITEPDYDSDGADPYNVEVIKRTVSSVILKDIDYNFTFERTFQHLLTCKIEEI